MEENAHPQATERLPILEAQGSYFLYNEDFYENYAVWA